MRGFFLVPAVMLFGAGAAHAIDYALPQERIPPTLAGPEMEIVRAHCSGCHSLDYLATQPRGKGAIFWREAVAKMVNVYGAPVTKDDAGTIADALARAFAEAEPVPPKANSD